MVLEFGRSLLVSIVTGLLGKYSFSGNLLRGNCSFFFLGELLFYFYFFINCF